MRRIEVLRLHRQSRELPPALGVRPESTFAAFCWSAATASLSGPIVGLEITPLLVDILSLPPAPFSVIHFSAGASPYTGGPLAFPAGTFTALAGQLWEARAEAYSLPATITGLTPIRALPW